MVAPRPARACSAPALQNSLRLALLLTGVLVSGCASTPASSRQSGAAPAGAPVVSVTGGGIQFIPVPLATAPAKGPHLRVVPPAAPLLAAAPGTPVTMDGRFRQMDDHYAALAADTKQLVQQAVAGMKQAPSAADVAALKATVGRLEAQLTRLTTASTRTEGALTGLTSRIQTVEQAQTERAAERAASATAPPPQKPMEPLRPSVDPVEAGFIEALAALNSPKEATEPMRTWVDLHPTHPKAPEGILQLGFRFLNRNYPAAAGYYFRRVITDYPMSFQAKEAQGVLASIRLPEAPKPTSTSKKPAKAAKPAKPVAKRTAPPVAPVNPSTLTREELPRESAIPAPPKTLTPTGQGAAPATTLLQIDPLKLSRESQEPSVQKSVGPAPAKTVAPRGKATTPAVPPLPPVELPKLPRESRKP